MSESPKVFVRRIGLVGFSQTFVSLKGLILLPIFTKLLGASDYGIWALILATIAILEPFIILGLNSAILRFLSSKTKPEIVQGLITVVVVVLIVGIIASCFLFFISDFIALNILKRPSDSYLIKIASPYVVLTALNSIILGSFRVFGMIKNFAIIVIFKTCLEIAFISYFVLSGFGLQGVILASIAISIISLITMLIVIFFNAGIARPDFSLLKPYLLFGLPLIPISLAQFVIEISDRYLVGFFLDSEKVGIYSAAYNIGVIPVMFSSYLVYILGPTVYDLYDKGRMDKVKMYLSYSWKYLLMLSIPAAFGLSILAKSLLVTMTTSIFISDGVYIIPLVALSMIFWGMEQIFGVTILIFKRRKIFVIAFVIASITNLILNIILIPYIGVIGAAITTLIAYILLASIIAYRSRSYIKFNLNFGFIIKCIFSSIIMTLCIWIIDPTEKIGLILSIIIGIIVYIGMLLLQKGFTKE
jgi:O-antigen/teichoic acid export membrane protein